MSSVNINELNVSEYTIPTDGPESDGTLQWDSTTLILVELTAGDKRGLGYTYSHSVAGRLIADKLRDIILGRDALDILRTVADCFHHARNLGRPGIVASAVSAVDIALWDLKSQLLDLPLVKLFGQVRGAVDVYGSGGFTSYSDAQLREQLAGWVEESIPRVKMKVGREPGHDPHRVAVARDAIGPDTKLFVDANGAYDRKQALLLAQRFAEQEVTWFEEPVSSDNLPGLHLLCERVPPGMEVTAGEYGYHPQYFRRMLEANAVDVLQADATRCGGFSGFLTVSSLCEAEPRPLSAHTAPTIHTHVCCAALPVRHLEYFHDHVRIEQMFFDGFPRLTKGQLAPDLSQPGLGLQVKRTDVEKYAVWKNN